MEEILSSIRRIIAEDDQGADTPPARQARGAPPAFAAAAPSDEEDDDVLDLTEVVAEPKPEPASPRLVPPAASEARPPTAAGPPPVRPVGSSPPAPGPKAESPSVPTPPNPTKEPAPMPADTAESLVSPGVASASTQAFVRLTKAAAAEEKKPMAALGAISVEQLLVDMLTPMLRDWLDKNLPEIVERIVEQEVKKLARRAELM
jgi:cell pole-organizing protein PopZ